MKILRVLVTICGLGFCLAGAAELSNGDETAAIRDVIYSAVCFKTASLISVIARLVQ